MNRLVVVGLASASLSAQVARGVDHSALDALLKEFVHGSRVDYRGLKAEASTLADYVRSLADVDVSKLDTKEQMALYINAYNAFTLTLILEHLTPGFGGITEIPEARRWKHKRWVVGGHTYSLDEIENTVLRARFGDARVHTAINCASVGCPDLRAEAFTGEKLDSQLDEQFRRFVNDPRHVRVRGGVLYVSAIFDWFKGDFTMGGVTVAEFIARYADDGLRRKIEGLGRGVRVKFLDYDWSLNTAAGAHGGK